MIQNTTTTHDFARDDVEVRPFADGAVSITRYVSFGKFEAHAIFTSVELSPAQAAFVRDALNTVLPKSENKS